MAKNFHFALISPEKLIYNGEIEAAIVPGAEGYMTILAHHTPMIAQLKPGFVDVRVGQEEHRFFIFGGILHISLQETALLAEHIIEERHLNIDDFDARIAKVREELYHLSDSAGADASAHRNKLEDFLHQLETVRGVYTAI